MDVFVFNVEIYILALKKRVHIHRALCNLLVSN